MTVLASLFERFAAAGEAPALLQDGQATSYGALLARCAELRRQLALRDCSGQTVLLCADYSAGSVALLLALWQEGNTVALLSNRPAAQQQELAALCQARWVISVAADGAVQFDATDALAGAALLRQLNAAREPGLIIFSSGSTGKPKAIVHRALPLLERHLAPRKRLRTIAFLLFDHIGGVNTLLYVLFNGGALVIPASRRPLEVAAAIERHQVQAMTTSPTFLNLLLLSGACASRDLSSLQIINYSSEPMPPSTLAALVAALPGVKLSQAYGMTEIGVVPARSRASGSVWMKLGDAETAVRVVDGLLEIKNGTTMLGYLGEESRVSADGYYRTGDAVEQDGEYFRILGRSSDLINIGGEKVYPAEIESVLRELPNVADVAVSHENNAITGKLIKATFVLVGDEALSDFKQRMLQFCHGRLAPFQIPRKVAVSQQALHNERYKKVRA